MKFTSPAAAAIMLALPAFAQTEPLTYDTTYDNANYSLNNVACSDGVNGLVTRGYTTLGSLPSFPYLGGVYPVKWNSTLCGACYKITYGSKSIYATAVDYAAEGYNLSEESMSELAGPAGIAAGKIYVTSMQVDASYCGL